MLFSKDLPINEISKSMYVGGHPYQKFKYVPPELANNPEKYQFNKFGYRADEFNTEESFGVLTVGCSHSFGWGIEQHQTYSSVFCQLLSKNIPNVRNWNLALPSKSNDYLSRTILNTIPFLKPKIVLVCFTGIYRKEYYDTEGRCLDYLLGRHIKKNDRLICRERHSSWWEEDKIYDHLTELTSSHESNMNFYKNYKLVELTMKLLDINWAFSTINQKQWFKKTNQAIDKSHYIDEWEKVDVVSPEDEHMGVQSHYRLAHNFHDHFTTSGKYRLR